VPDLTPTLIVLALLLLNGLFVAAEFAIVAAPRTAIEQRALRGERIARIVRNVLASARWQDRYIATAQLGITAASLGLGMYGEHHLADWLESMFESLGDTRWVAAHAVASALAVTTLTYFHIVIGEMVPKSIALQASERAAVWITPWMLAFEVLLFPLVWVLNAVGNSLLATAGITRQASADRYYTPEELRLVVRESEAGGALRADAGRMLQELFEFGDLTAAQVMVPRVRVTGLEVGSTPDEVRELIRTAPHTRLPVYDGDLDHIVGMVHIKDLLRHLAEDAPVRATGTRPLPVVPETAALDDVLGVMRRERTQMAVVIDEHGGTAGVVTLEDLVEEVVGEIDESPGGKPPIYADEAGRLRVAGTVRLEEVGQRFGLDLAHEDVASVSGLVLALLGRPPKVRDAVDYEGLRFEVTAIQGRGVKECTVTKSG
jgi:CBS domain containing-hemolysin-like protein